MSVAEQGRQFDKVDPPTFGLGVFYNRISLVQYRHAPRYGERTPADALRGVYSLTHCEPGCIILKTKLGTD